MNGYAVFLIFDPKHKLLILVRTASMFLAKILKNQTVSNFLMKVHFCTGDILYIASSSFRKDSEAKMMGDYFLIVSAVQVK